MSRRPILAISLSATLVAGVFAAPARSAQTVACRPIDGLAPLLKRGTVLWLGEIHGAAEPPAFTRDVACAAAAEGLDVSVALEIPTVEDGRVQTFFESRGTPADVQALVGGAFWQRPYQDGRSSHARVELLDGLRRLREAGRKVRVRLIDPGELPAAERDRGMAGLMTAALDAAPQALHVALLGNVHTSLDRGTPWNKEFEPAAHLTVLARSAVKQVALDLAHTGGTVWTCTSAEVSACGSRELKGNPASKPWTIAFHTDGRRRGHDGAYGVGPLTMSPPAKQH